MSKGLSEGPKFNVEFRRQVVIFPIESSCLRCNDHFISKEFHIAIF